MADCEHCERPETLPLGVRRGYETTSNQNVEHEGLRGGKAKFFSFAEALRGIRRDAELGVAVGMRVSPHPPHGSRRAELPHRALASGNDAKTNLWIGVANSGGR
jgi:hypothetical protein